MERIYKNNKTRRNLFVLVDILNFILFTEVRAIAQARTGTHASSFTCAIYRTRRIIVFSLLVSLLLYISCKKFFIEGFFIEDYMQGI